MTSQRYFLGANSKAGFYSLYNDFPPGDDCRSYYIKSGPGTGKSGFMKALGQAALDRGMDVHYVLCSGDPDSLDGVYLPAAKLSVVDATAPHVLEPRLFGAQGEYLHLGQFFRGPLEETDKDHISRSTRDYKACYARAYRYLAAAAATPLPEPDSRSCALISAKAADLLGNVAAGPTGQTRRERRFLHAISCQGELRLEEEIKKLCSTIVQLSCPGASEILATLDRAAAGRGLYRICCFSPLEPEKLEALMLPGADLAFTDAGWSLPFSQVLGDAPAPTEASRLRGELCACAISELRLAKALHDELESVYKRYMDFAALSAFTQHKIHALLP